MRRPHSAGLTRTEVIIALCVLGILAALLQPMVTGVLDGGSAIKRRDMSRSLSNMKQLHMATYTMAADGVTNAGWPGDLGGTFAAWGKALVPEYLTTNDFCKLLSAPGKTVREGRMPVMAESAVLVYQVSRESRDRMVFLTTANFTNTPTGGLPPTRDAKPFGAVGFAVFRAGGDGAIYRGKQAADTNLQGAFVPLCE